MFQDIDGNAFIIDDTVRPLMEGPEVSDGVTDILALVDADGKSCEPNKDLYKVRNLRILLASSPRTNDKRRWLTHRVGDLHATFIMKPWSREEFVVTSFVYLPIVVGTYLVHVSKRQNLLLFFATPKVRSRKRLMIAACLRLPPACSVVTRCIAHSKYARRPRIGFGMAIS